ncbi:MAG: hypothetical protein HY517_02630 [Candidatus Aenigmarchaeota archaeon]|nr:hypothetical protein [Candidatus Aenigmarchaeota archaeon]
MEIAHIDDIKVMYIIAANGTQGAKEAFDELERHVPLKGRKFYGTVLNGEYRACVAVDDDSEITKTGLSVTTIPGGNYARKKIQDWLRNVREIGPTFESMATQCNEDTSRPRVEFYRSMSDLVLMLPVNE